MTDERDPKLQSAYRALGAEEPPRALDEAILGAARRSVQPWTRRWAVPLSLAAVVVLSVTVTLRIQHEQRDIEMPAPVDKEVTQAEKPAATTPLPKPASRREAEAFPRSTQDRAVAENRAAAPAQVTATTAETPALAKRADTQAPSAAESTAGPAAAPPAPASAPAMRAMLRERVAAERVAATPEQELERIAELRKQAKHDEADKALAEFRKRYADYKIPEAMLERVQRR